MLLEAMALGTPVVSTAIMGTRDLLWEGEGAVIVEEDETAFTMAVANLLRDELLRDELRRRKLGAAGQRYAEQWTARDDAASARLLPGGGRCASMRPARAARCLRACQQIDDADSSTRTSRLRLS